MKTSAMSVSWAITAIYLLLISVACSGGVPAGSPTVSGTSDVQPELKNPVYLPLTIKDAQQQPGLLLSGYVRLADGVPLAGVQLYRSYANYPPVQVATTDSEGYYHSEFAPIPGDEMVTVYAELEGYTFEPAQNNWRHYYGFEERRLDFKANISP